jgi:hypothetical protein
MMIDIETTWARAELITSVRPVTDYGVNWWVVVDGYGTAFPITFGSCRTKEEAAEQAADFAKRVNAALV